MVNLSDIPADYLGAYFFILGALFGSFANVVIYRLPQGLSVVKPRSRCGHCGHQVAWYDNIPIVSYFVLRGRCRHCMQRFSWRYPVVELLMAVTFCGLFYVYGLSFTLVEYLVFAFGLITVSFIDFDHMILPDVFTLSGTVLGLIGAALNPEREFLPALLGVIVGGGFLWAVAAIYFAFRKIEGMGGGDIKLLAWIGAMLGWTAIPFVILSASVIGTLVGFALMLKNKGNMQTAIPFGPYLALGAFLFVFGGQELAHRYFFFFIPSLSP